MEQWRDIAGFEGLYQVSDLGRFRSFDKIRAIGRGQRLIPGRVLKPTLGFSGYWVLSLSDHSRQKRQYRAHRLIAQAFIPNPNKKPEINHKNGNRADNRLDNLEWVTASENHQHAFVTGLQVARCGESHHNAKLTEFQVRVIRRLYEFGGITQTAIAALFNVAYQTIHVIVRHKRWKAV